MAAVGIVEGILGEARASGVDLGAWGVAWARTLPTALLVPAFGARLLPVPLRAALGLGLAVCVAPTVSSPPVTASFPVVLLTEFLHGVPVAIVAATVVWAALVAGGVMDVAVGVRRSPAEGPLATLLGLAAAALFLQNGGAVLVAERLTLATGPTAAPLLSAVRGVTAGITIGASIGAPVLVVGAASDVALSLAERELGPGRLGSASVPLRSALVLVFVAALFERILVALSALVA
ncbi:MAG TPA: flagellar biosynthetic protein FliR [Polyangiaceae bacterium]|nr:flagellar biosynthetic protein FliR [Polyangiaceae bacterium]